MRKKKYLTWQQLKDFCNSLSAGQLKKSVTYWGEEAAGKAMSTYILPEDYVTTDYGIEPGSVQEYEEGDEPYPVTHRKGLPILNID